MWWFLDCRYGRSLLRSRDWTDLLVWEPLTGERTCVAVPHRVQAGASGRNAAVFCAAGAGDDGNDCHSIPFHVAVVFTSQRRASACVYSSLTGAWGEPISTQEPSPCDELDEEPGALVGDALYWLHGASGIIKLEFGMMRLALVERPPEAHSIYKWNIRVMRSEDGV